MTQSVAALPFCGGNSTGERGKAATSQAGMSCRVPEAFFDAEDDEQSGQPNAPRENQRAGGMCTAVCEVATRPRATMMDAELEELGCARCA